MSEKLTIKRIVVDEFEYEKRDINYSIPPMWRPGEVAKIRKCVLRIFTDGGPVGEYVTRDTYTSTLPSFARSLIGKNALQREYLWTMILHRLRHPALGLGAIDVALWDIAGKFFDVPVYELLGYYRKELPAYPSTLTADGVEGGLDSAEAYAEFAEECLKRGYRAFKMHGWRFNVEQDVATIHAVRERVGDKMDLMLDAGCHVATFADALKIGRACDEEHFLWLEDPSPEGGVSAFAHRKLRQLIKTPLLMGERLYTVYPKVDFIVADGTDFIRGDINKDGGITGLMKVAHAAEGFGLDIEILGCNIASQHCMSAIRNTNYLELGLAHPKVFAGELFDTAEEYLLSGYKGGLDAIDSNGCIRITEGPGLGVQLNWDFIEKYKISSKTYD